MLSICTVLVLAPLSASAVLRTDAEREQRIWGCATREVEVVIPSTAK